MNFIIALGLLLVSYVIQALVAPKPQDQKPASVDDFDFPQFEEGTPQCVFFGDTWTKDWMVLGTGNYRNRAIRASGGKGK